jgi:putative acyl-CoA dehydrogenase
MLAAVDREGAGWARDGLHELGLLAGRAETAEAARLANEHPPVLRSHDRYGNRIDEVEFHPAWHALMDTAVSHGLHAAPWADPRPGAHVARAAKFYVWTQAEAGHGCPISMTYAVVPALRHNPGLADRLEPLLTACAYDPGLRPAETKRGLLAGMAMTEKQGGSDVRANTTRAEPAPAAGPDAHVLTGHKWFCSAPMSDMFLTLAQGPAGLTCFLLPRVLPGGERNGMRLQRLKDKLGNRSNASAEVEFDGALAYQVGEPGRGIATIIAMVSATRLDCVIGSAAGIRAATVAAVHHATHRQAFGKELAAQPLMANVLADLALESEAAAVLTFRLARAYDEDTEEAAVFRRVVTPAAKFWICKRAPFVALEAMEVLGGSGYIEESVLPRIYREAPVNSIWEGSGNVMCLDVLRAIERTPRAAEVLAAELELDGEPRVRPFLDRLSQRLSAPDRHDEAQARALVRDLVLALQAVLLVKHAPAAVADAFCASRIGTDAGAAFGL